MRESGLVAKHYLHTWFAIDLVASLPYEVIGEIVYSRDTAASSNEHSQIKLLAFLKVEIETNQMTQPFPYPLD